MKKVLTTIAIILFIIALITVVLWLRARKRVAEETGTTLSFRTFITQGDPTRGTPGDRGGILSPDGSTSDTGSGTGTGLVQPGMPGAPDAPTPGIPGAPGTPGMPTGSGIVVSEFTGVPITPTQGPGLGLPGSPVSPGAPGAPTAPGTPGIVGTPISSDTPTGPAAPSAPTGTVTIGSGTQGPLAACSDADLYIAFTPEELTRLGQLQDQFLDIAETLRTDGDVAAEAANYTTFAAKSAQVTELYGYCQAKAPQIQGVAYQNRVPTPYWRNPQYDKSGYIGGLNISSGDFGDGDVNLVAGSNISKAVLERFFRISLW